MESITGKLMELNGKTIIFNEEVKKTESDFSPKQKAKVIEAHIVEGSDDEVFALKLDFKEYAEENKVYAERNYWDKNGEPTLAWHETGYYPTSDKLTVEYFEVSGLMTSKLPFEIL